MSTSFKGMGSSYDVLLPLAARALESVSTCDVLILGEAAMLCSNASQRCSRSLVGENMAKFRTLLHSWSGTGSWLSGAIIGIGSAGSGGTVETSLVVSCLGCGSHTRSLTYPGRENRVAPKLHATASETYTYRRRATQGIRQEGRFPCYASPWRWRARSTWDSTRARCR